jgi:beta-galactosidase
MRGVNVHHDHGPMGAVRLQASEDRRITLREAGFNAYRSAHNPASPAVLDACDRYGMLVIEEAFDTWNRTKVPEDYGNHFAEWWQRDVTAWVQNARNHPSVVLYSIGNEISPTGAGFILTHDFLLFAEQGTAIADLVRELDPTRPICQGGAQGISFIYDGPVSSADSYTDVGDVHYQQDYGAKPAAHPGRAWIQSESWPQTIFEDWKLVTSNAYAIGDFVWTGWDYMGEAGIGAPLIVPAGTGATIPGYTQVDPVAGTAAAFSDVQPYPFYTAGCGDFDLIGQPTPQLRYRQVVWGESDIEMMVERPVGNGREQRAEVWGWYDELESWTWDVPAGESLRVRVYTSGDTVELFLNGETVGSNSLSATDRMVTNFPVRYARVSSWRSRTRWGRRSAERRSRRPAGLMRSA